ncbi:MAG: hypothetical protein BWY09_01079 [Candidatus Hydrogenedentes bacterium ADurb.Bin179]|nr:MAG: hypothetical protein BWY09_01079 [Candidatus Hydrogenedentes bacterium ADurb.Bin179]
MFFHKIAGKVNNAVRRFCQECCARANSNGFMPYHCRSTQSFKHFMNGLEPLCRVRRQRALRHAIPVGVNAWHLLTRQFPAADGEVACKQEIRQYANGINVALFSPLLAFLHFGRHVMKGSDK